MTIGGDKIFQKWYAKHVSLKTFQKITQLDPTSVAKPKLFKPGKYCKWLMLQYFKENFEKLNYNVVVTDKTFKLPKEARDKIFNALHIYHHWYKRKNPKYADINKYSTLGDFLSDMRSAENEYETYQKYKDKVGKVFTIYDDENVTVLEPLDFAACYRYSKHTEWCSKSENSYNSWKESNILLRFIDKKNNIIFRLTWSYVNKNSWSWATPVYPEFNQYQFADISIEPFDFDKFIKKITRRDWQKDDDYQKTVERFNQLQNLFNVLNKECVEQIYHLYNIRLQEFIDKIEQRKKDAMQAEMISAKNVAEWEYSGMLMYH